MANFDKYRRKVELNGGSISESYEASTVSAINNSFADSPNYYVVQIDGEDTEVRFTHNDSDSNKGTLLFRPYTQKPIGAIVDYDGFKWLVFEFFDKKIMTSSIIQRCNTVLKWKDKDSIVHELTCFASTMKYIRFGIMPNRYDVDLMDGGLFVFVQNNAEAKQIKPSQRFILGSQVYEIVGIDDLSFRDKNGGGMIQFTTKLSTLNSKDDFVNQIADNTVVNSKLNQNGDSGGKKLW